MKRVDGCLEDNKGGGLLSFLRRIFSPDPYEALNDSGMVQPHVAPRSIEELGDALRPEDTAQPCQDE